MLQKTFKFRKKAVDHITALQAIWFFKWFIHFYFLVWFILQQVHSEELFRCPKEKTWRQHSLKEILNNNNIKWPRVLENKKPSTKEYHAAFHPVCVIQLTILPWRTCAKSTITLVYDVVLKVQVSFPYLSWTLDI